VRRYWAAAERAIALNPLDGCNVASLGGTTAYAGNWEYGYGLVERALQINPHHPGWYWFPVFFNAYRKGDYRGALSFALRINLPGLPQKHMAITAAHGQLREYDAAGITAREARDMAGSGARRTYDRRVPRSGI
jgi:hypothetical protein